MKNALEYVDAILGDRRPALFLDFDGTLAEIAPRPDRVVLRASVREVLKTLAQCGVSIAVVSGRDLEDLRARLDLPGFAYAGSHGFDLLGPPPACERFQPGFAFLAQLDGIEARLRERLARVPGVFMERKRFAFAVHYRQVADAAVPDIEAAVRVAVAQDPDIEVREGKRVFEMVPAVRWDKGQAVLWLMERMPIEGTPIYVGDDLTDEDAFNALHGRGAGIVVQETAAPSAAAYRLRNPDDVERFLGCVAERLGG